MTRPQEHVQPKTDCNSSLKRLRVLIPTSRHIYRLVSYGMILDFEDAVAAASDVDLVPVPLYSRRAQIQGLLRGKPLRSVSAPRPRYDVCLLVAMAPYWIPSLRYVRNLRNVANRVVVYLFDSWLTDLPSLQADRDLRSLADDLIVSFKHTVEPYVAGLPCRVHYLPQAADPRWFAPHDGERPIDVLSLGRRLPEVHTQLLEISRRRDFFYHYKTHEAPQVMDFRENQEFIGRLGQLSHAHVSWSVDRTNPQRRDEGAAITARWFESAACGSMVIGAAPQTDEFARLFPYPDFVRTLDPGDPVHTEEVVESARSNSHEPERRELAEYVRTRHSWDQRWREIVEICEL